MPVASGRRAASRSIEARSSGVVGVSAVAVPLASHPAPPPDPGSEPRGAGPHVVRAERAVQLPIELGYQEEQGGVENGECAPDLIEWRGALPPKLLGTPENGDLFHEPAMDSGLLGERQPRIVKPTDQFSDPLERVNHGSPPCLRGMGGHHGGDAETAEQILQDGLTLS